MISFLSPYYIMVAGGLLAAFLVLNYNLAVQRAPVALRVKTNAAQLAGCLAIWPAAHFGLWVFMGAKPGELFTTGGISFYPGLLGFLGAAALAALLLRLPVGQTMDTIAPGVPLFHAFGRVGCWFGGCCYGAECDFTLFGVRFTHLPTQLMEAAFCLVLFFALEYAVKRHRLAVYLCAYAVWRFVIEFWRADERGALLPGVPLSPAQQIAVLCLLGVGLAALWPRLLARRTRGPAGTGPPATANAACNVQQTTRASARKAKAEENI